MSEEQPLPGSSVLPIQCLPNPQFAVATKLGLDPECIRVVSVETLNPEEIKVRFIIL